MLCCWCGARVGTGEERGFVLIVHPYPLTDTSQHAALWESEPTFREGERIDRSRCRIVRCKARGKKLMPAGHAALRRLLCFTHRFNCAKHCFISLVLCRVYIYMRFVFKQRVKTREMFFVLGFRSG